MNTVMSITGVTHNLNFF